MLTGIGTPTAWPFFKPFPVGQVLRSALGAAVGGGVDHLDFPGINVSIGDLILVATCHDGPLISPTVDVDIDGDVFNLDAVRNSTTNLVQVTVSSYITPAAIVGAQITVKWPVSDPVSLAAIVIKVSGITSGFVGSKATSYLTTTDPDTGVYAGFPAHRFEWGIVGTKGKQTDTLGNWMHLLTAGQRASFAGTPLRVDLKEGYLLGGSIAESHIQSQTDRNSANIIALYD